MQLAADLESSSEHPLAKAVMEHAKASGISNTAVHDFQALPGNGLSAVRGEDLLLGGSISYMQQKVSVDAAMTEQAKKLAEEGKTMVVVTHEMGFARHVSTHVIFLHQGKLEEEGAPEQLFGNPQSPRLQQFLKGSLK